MFKQQAKQFNTPITVNDVLTSLPAAMKPQTYLMSHHNSERGKGANLAIFDNFESLLQPQMVVPTPEFESTSPDLIYAKIFGYGG